MSIGAYIMSFLLALVVSFLLMPPFIRLMVKYKFLDKSGGRKIHTGYTAHMGGIIIFTSFAVSVTAMLFVYFKVTNAEQMISFAAAMLITMFIGIRDDMNDIGPWTKLGLEIIVGLLLAYIGIRVTAITGFSKDQIIYVPDWISYGATVCFFVVVTNSYNLIDGIDGQAGMQALNTFFFLFVFFIFQVGDHRVSAPFSALFIEVCLVAIMGAIIGFLRYNWEKAEIFMGDTGSLFIGTLLTIFSILAMTYSAGLAVISSSQLTMKSYVAPFLGCFYLPMADTLRVFVSRVRKGRSPFTADKTHIHHYFIRLGYSHQRCTLTTFAISFCISIVSVVLSFLVSDLILVLIIIVSWFLYVRLIHLFVIKKIRQREETV